MRLLVRGVKRPLNVSVQCSHDADACHHGRAGVLYNQRHGFDRGLPFRDLLFGRRQLLDMFYGVLKVTS